MGKFIDITGQKFGRLTVIKRVENDKWNKARWLCKCECGNEVIVVGTSLRSGETQSCGCYMLDRIKECNTKHSQCSTKLYYVYCDMKERCYRKTKKNYCNYGGRGIGVCEEWLSDFQNFYDWALNNGYQEDLTIDRIDNNGNYEPSNCRWTTRYVQNRNKRSNRYITFEGKTMTLTDWSLYLGFSDDTVRRRLKDGWSVERALTEPRHEQNVSKHKTRNCDD